MRLTFNVANNTLKTMANNLKPAKSNWEVMAPQFLCEDEFKAYQNNTFDMSINGKQVRRMDKGETFTHVGSKFKINNQECMLDYGPQNKQIYTGTYSNYINLHSSVSNSYCAMAKRQLIISSLKCEISLRVLRVILLSYT